MIGEDEIAISTSSFDGWIVIEDRGLPDLNPKEKKHVCAFLLGLVDEEKNGK